MKKLTDHLQYSLWIYLLIAVVVIAFWVTVFGVLASPADNERVSILYFGSGLDSAALEADLSSRIGSLTDQPIRQITVEAVDTNNRTVVVQLLPTRVYDTDLIILPKEMLEDFSCKTFFPEIPQDKPELLPHQAQYFYEEEVPYGFLLGGGGTDNHFSSFYSGDEACYVFFSSRSVNLGGLLSEGEPGDDAALAILKYLLE